MRRTAAIVLGTLVTLAVLGAVVVVGLRQADEARGPGGQAKPSVLTREDITARLTGSPEPLAALHGRGGEIADGGPDTYARELARLRGYPVVVNLWAAWCPPCKREIPLFQAATRDLGKRVAFLGVNVLDNRNDARSLLRDFFLPYPSVEDPRGLIREALGPGSGLPMTVFYTADGQRNHVQQGEYASLADLTSDIERYAVKGS